jgi:hypothetical protein
VCIFVLFVKFLAEHAIRLTSDRERHAVRVDANVGRSRLLRQDRPQKFETAFVRALGNIDLAVMRRADKDANRVHDSSRIIFIFFFHCSPPSHDGQIAKPKWKHHHFSHPIRRRQEQYYKRKERGGEKPHMTVGNHGAGDKRRCPQQQCKSKGGGSGNSIGYHHAVPL